MKKLTVLLFFVIGSISAFTQTIEGTKVTSPIVPNSILDPYPTHDAYWGKDGYRSVSRITERDSIKIAYRKEGMQVYVKADSSVYQLRYGITNANWFKLGNGGSIIYANNGLTKDVDTIKLGGMFNNNINIQSNIGKSYRIQGTSSTGYSVYNVLMDTTQITHYIAGNFGAETCLMSLDMINRKAPVFRTYISGVLGNKTTAITQDSIKVKIEGKQEVTDTIRSNKGIRSPGYYNMDGTPIGSQTPVQVATIVHDSLIQQKVNIPNKLQIGNNLILKNVKKDTIVTKVLTLHGDTVKYAETTLGGSGSIDSSKLVTKYNIGNASLNTGYYIFSPNNISETDFGNNRFQVANNSLNVNYAMIFQDSSGISNISASRYITLAAGLYPKISTYTLNNNGLYANANYGARNISNPGWLTPKSYVDSTVLANSGGGITTQFVNDKVKWKDSTQVHLGRYALGDNSGSYNVSIGANTMSYTNTGNNNTAIGSYALRVNSSGYNNLANGNSALYSNTIGAYNTAIGNGALSANISGNLNIGIGRNVGNGGSATLDSRLYIGNNSSDSTVLPIWSNMDTHKIILNNEVGIHKYPTCALDVNGQIKTTQLTGALTDGAPTAAQINTATGLTPSTAGAGYTAIIHDTDGSQLDYRIYSNGTTWSYWVGTTAL